MISKRIGDLVSSGEIVIKTGPFGTQLKAAEYVKIGTPVLNVKNLGFGKVVNRIVALLESIDTRILLNEKINDNLAA